MSHRTFIVGNEYTRYTCSPGGGCRLGLVQLGVLISGYFIPPPFPLRPSLLTTFPLSPILIPEPASLPRPLLHLSFSFPSTSNIPLSPMPLKCTIAPSVGQYEQEAYIANYTVLCHQAWGWYIDRNTPRNLWRQRETRERGWRVVVLCAARRNRRFSYYPFYRFRPYQKRGSN